MFIEDDGHSTQIILRSAAQFIVFPSFLMHQVKPITDGERHSIVSWFTGPQMK